MRYLQDSWGYVLMIGGLFITWVFLMILDGPAQRRDALRRQDEGLKAEEGRASGSGGTGSPPPPPPVPNPHGRVAK